MSEEMAMSVPFPEMMSWNIYFFYFELSDNNANIVNATIKTKNHVGIIDIGLELDNIDTDYVDVYLHDTTSQVELIFKSEPYSGVIEDKDKIDGLMIFPDGSVEIQHFGTNGEKINFQPKPKCNGKTFVGWTTDGKNLITSDELKEMVYEKRTTYYAVYEDNTEGFTVIINSGIGKFIDGTTQKKVLNVHPLSHYHNFQLLNLHPF